MVSVCEDGYMYVPVQNCDAGASVHLEKGIIVGAIRPVTVGLELSSYDNFVSVSDTENGQEVHTGNAESGPLTSSGEGILENEPHVAICVLECRVREQKN